MAKDNPLINPALRRVADARQARQETLFYTATRPIQAKNLKDMWDVFVLGGSHAAWNLYMYDLGRVPLIPLQAQ